MKRSDCQMTKEIVKCQWPERKVTGMVWPGADEVMTFPFLPIWQIPFEGLKEKALQSSTFIQTDAHCIGNLNKIHQ